MISREFARMLLGLAIFFIVAPGLLLLTQDPGSAGFVVTVLTLGIGLVMLMLALGVWKLTIRHDDHDDHDRT